MKKLPLFLVAMLHTASVGAQASPKILLEVRATRISRAELEGSLREELSANDAAGTLTLSEEPSDMVRISYRDGAGNLSVRELRIAQDDPDALEKVTLAAATLLRSQDALLATLNAEKPAAPAPTAREQFAALAAPSGEDPCALAPVMAIGLDLAPGLGVSSLRQGRTSARRLSLSLLGSLSGGTRGVTLSAGINIDRRGTCGLSLGNVNSALGPLRGLQLGNANFARGGVRGVQGAVLNAATGGAVGAQLGVANALLGDLRGAQLGVVNLTVGGVRGLQAATVNVSWGDELTGAQLGVANAARGDLHGLQAGVANLGLGSASVQLGAFNYAQHDVTTQIGVLNVSRDAKAPIGVLSIVRHGRTSLDAWATETGTLLAGFSHGGRYVHNVYGVGTRVGPRGTRFVYSLGIGARLLTRERFQLDFDVLGEQLVDGGDFADASLVSRARLAFSVRLIDRLSLLVAPGYAFMLAQDSERPQSMFGATRVFTDTTGSGQERGYLFPSLALGLRVSLDRAKP